MEFINHKQEDQNQSAVDELQMENLNMTLNPLEMEDTLAPIVQFFCSDGSFLRSTRFLSKLWNQVSLKTFLKSHFLRVPPNFYSDFPTQEEKDEGLSKIKQLLESVGKIQNISFNDDFSSDMKIFRSLDQIQWDKITQIRFHFQFKTDTPNPQKIEGSAKFISEMMTKCPHLKFLDIPPQSDRSFSQEIGLSLMEFCVNLKKNENFTISNLAAIVSTKRDAELVVGFSKTGVRVLNFLAKPLYQLKNTCPLEIPAVIKAFEKIIETNKNHLISLGLNDRREILSPDFELPEKMPQMDILHLAGDRMSQLKFKAGFQFHKNFPNLTEVNFKLDGLCWSGRNHFWTNLFQNQNQSPCRFVKRLKVMSLDKIEEEIFQVFPEIEELRVCERIVVTSPLIFQFLQKNCQKLKILKMEVPDNKFEWHGTQIRFVSNISGFSNQIVRTLMAANKSDSNIKIQFVGDFPRTEAFAILKNLEQLHLNCSDEAEITGFCEKYMEFLQTHVFNTMPKLKVEKKCGKGKSKV